MRRTPSLFPGISALVGDRKSNNDLFSQFAELVWLKMRFDHGSNSIKIEHGLTFIGFIIWRIVNRSVEWILRFFHEYWNHCQRTKQLRAQYAVDGGRTFMHVVFWLSHKCIIHRQISKYLQKYILCFTSPKYQGVLSCFASDL